MLDTEGIGAILVGLVIFMYIIKSKEKLKRFILRKFSK
jgi:hypothetical protein